MILTSPSRITSNPIWTGRSLIRYRVASDRPQTRTGYATALPGVDASRLLIDSDKFGAVSLLTTTGNLIATLPCAKNVSFRTDGCTVAIEGDFAHGDSTLAVMLAEPAMMLRRRLCAPLFAPIF
jgi:hypothetical protein